MIDQNKVLPRRFKFGFITPPTTKVADYNHVQFHRTRHDYLNYTFCTYLPYNKVYKSTAIC